MQRTIMKQRQAASDQKSRIKSFKSELHEVTQQIQEPCTCLDHSFFFWSLSTDFKDRWLWFESYLFVSLLFLFFYSSFYSSSTRAALLKESAIRLHSKFVLKKVETGELDVEITQEYQRQQEYLEKSVEALKRRLRRDR